MKRITGRLTKFVRMLVIFVVFVMLYGAYVEFTKVTIIHGYTTVGNTYSNDSILEYSYNGNGFDNNW